MPDQQRVRDITRRIHAAYTREDPDAKPTFGFHRLTQSAGPWPEPAAFLETHASVTVVDPQRVTTSLTLTRWHARPATPIPNDALTALHASSPYSARHTRQSLACLIGERVHFRLLLRAISADGNGWRYVSRDFKDLETRETIRCLFQPSFPPVQRPRVPHTVWASFCPPPEKQSPLDELIASLAHTAWTGLQKARPSWSFVAAELPVLLPGRRFQTHPQTPRYLCPILDAVAVSRESGRVAVIDYKSTLGTRPVVSSRYIAQLLVNAYCFAKMTGLVPDVCVLVYATRSDEAHLLEFPFRAALRHPYICDVLGKAFSAFPSVAQPIR